MRPIEEIRKNPKLMFKKQEMMVGIGTCAGVYMGYIIISGGKGTFVMGMNEEGWEHVSVELFKRLPSWEQMCEVKDIFWDEEEEVVQIHPKKSEYVDMVDALHLWRPKDGDWSLMNSREKGGEGE